MIEPYIPSRDDIHWARNILASLADGGTWGIPRSEQVYTVHHTIKELHLIRGDIDTDIGENDFTKNQILFAEVGYLVLDKRT